MQTRDIAGGGGDKKRLCTVHLGAARGLGAFLRVECELGHLQGSVASLLAVRVLGLTQAVTDVTVGSAKGGVDLHGPDALLAARLKIEAQNDYIIKITTPRTLCTVFTTSKTGVPGHNAISQGSTYRNEVDGLGVLSQAVVLCPYVPELGKLLNGRRPPRERDDFADVDGFAHGQRLHVRCRARGSRRALQINYEWQAD